MASGRVDPRRASVGGDTRRDAPAPAAASKPALELLPGLRYWVRGSARVNETFDAGAQPVDTDIRQQARLHVTGRYGPVSGFLQFQDARLWGFEQSTLADESHTDLHQGYLELRGRDEGRDLWGELRVGRQEIQFGSRRLIADRPWNLVGQAFDAVRARGHFLRYELDGWFAILRRPERFSVPSEQEGAPDTEYTTTTSFIGGLQLTAAFTREFTVAAQLLGTRKQPTEDDPEDTREMYNVGLRFVGEPVAGLWYELEGLYQGGRQRGRPHSAWALAAVVNYTFSKSKIKPTLHAGYTIASGEACVNAPGEGVSCEYEGRSTEFWDWAGRRHGYQGYMDLFGLRNVRDLELGSWLTPARGLTLELVYHYFQLHEPRGHWRNTRLVSVGQGWDPDNVDHSLGHEIDMVVSYLPWKDHVTIQPGYALFIPVAAGRTLGGGADPQHLLYLLLATQF